MRMPSKRQALNDHEQDCHHRNVQCPVLICKDMVAASKLSFHFKDAHVAIKEIKIDGIFKGVIPFYPEKFKNLNKRVVWQPDFTLLFEEKFFYWEIIRSQRNTYMWLYVNGTTKEEDNFTYTFTLYNVNKVCTFYSNILWYRTCCIKCPSN